MFLLRLLPKASDPNRILLIPVLFIHLDPSRIPTAEELDSILCSVDPDPELSRVTGATAALRAVSLMLEARVIPPSLYVDFFPHLYEWTVFIHAYWENIPGDYLLDLTQTYRASAIIILVLYQEDSIADIVSKAPGLRRILAEFWAKFVRKLLPGVDDMEPTYILQFLFNEITDANNFAEILDGIGGTESDLAYLLVQQINDTVARPVSRMTSMSLHTIIQVLNTKRHDPLRAGMLFHDGVKAVIAAIAFEDQARFRWEIVGEAVYLGALFLLGNFESTSGAKWMSQALSAGLLKLIASLGSFRLTTAPREMWYTYSILQRFLKKILPEYLMYYNIACQIKEALPRVLSITSTTPLTNSVIYPFWTEFAGLAEERLGALDFYLARRSTSMNACENIQCRKTGQKTAFKSCAGCDVAYYCSRDCQKADWASGHRRSCRTPGSAGPSSARDRCYLRAILQYNFQFPAIRIQVLTRQAQFIGTEWIHVPSGTGWSDVKPMSDYYAAASARLVQLARSAEVIRVHLATLSILDTTAYTPSSSAECMFPVWSTSHLHDRLVRIVQSLPRGLQSAGLDAALVQPLRALAASEANLF
ncbi:hypothetical protein B0H17DRAFT_1201870 [Mycena rosella]|uniref:MYND-type domain-containing protein n=1 Tax=Mycena rosella TaxID=1033263 RepID=A0AAD7DH03_MYCRO|nr:hypothetical protein B0H17DRAFT_1201870 [Mycena rosella]